MKQSGPENRQLKSTSAKGTRTVVKVHLNTDELAVLDAWIKSRHERTTRPDAIRQLVMTTLEPIDKRRRRRVTTITASAMAGDQIDRVEDGSATADERQKRKRRLIKGPPEFRNIRRDTPKQKP